MSSHLVALSCVAAVFAGCVTGAPLREHSVYVEDNAERLHDAALRCDAEREIALAESHLEFAQYEMLRGNYLPARRHMLIAIENIDLVERIVGDRPECFGIAVVTDQDGDGIPDDMDNCPLTPNTDQADVDDDGIGDVCDDTDEDGIFDSDDNCIYDPNTDQADLDEDGIGDVCDPDIDGDDILNEDDNCVTTYNPDQTDTDGDGVGDACSADRDGDGIPDDDDECPDVPEDPDGFEDSDGCPEDDNDGDGILDPVDGDDPDGDGFGSCRDEPEDFDGDQDEDGCPEETTMVIVTDDMIEITEAIQFEFDSANIVGDVSFQILADVADVLRSNPDMQIRIEGHTDSQGSASYNLELSEDRAASVREYLMSVGIDSWRMTSVGYGEERPIDDNSTDEGRQNNRRVEFHITDQ